MDRYRALGACAALACILTFAEMGGYLSPPQFLSSAQVASGDTENLRLSLLGRTSRWAGDIAVTENLGRRGRTYFGRIDPGKGVEVLLDAWSRLGYGPGEGQTLVEDYRRAARRARAVMDRLFYG